MRQNQLNFRTDRALKAKVDKIFADGIRREDPLEEMLVRQSAYCLSLGFSLDYIRNVKAPEYERLVQIQAERMERHQTRMEEFKAEHGKTARLPLNDCCGADETPYCRVVR